MPEAHRGRVVGRPAHPSKWRWMRARICRSDAKALVELSSLSRRKTVSRIPTTPSRVSRGASHVSYDDLNSRDIVTARRDPIRWTAQLSWSAIGSISCVGPFRGRRKSTGSVASEPPGPVLGAPSGRTSSSIDRSRWPSGRRVSGFVQVAQNLPRTSRIVLFERGHEQRRFPPGQGLDTGC
jgi:hypothetical protein